MKTFRSSSPQRTYTGLQKSNYQDYREHLAQDFNHRCGYTDCRDMWWAGGFQIDHFAPQKPKITDAGKLAKFTALESVYGNLVYACPQINRAKSNDWATDDPEKPTTESMGYYDPCLDFNEYFERTDSGGIVPKADPVAEYMWRKLKLYLRRYEFFWRLDQLHDRKVELHRLRNLPGIPDAEKRDIVQAIVDLDDEFTSYLQYLSGNYSQIVR